MQEADRNRFQLSRLSVVLFISAALLVMPNLPVSSVAAENGPREEDLVIHFYDSWESAYTALTLGDIDMMLFQLYSSQVNNAFTNPNIVTAKVPYLGFYQFDLNNNWSIPAYPSIRSPMNYTEMRQAVAWLTNKDYIVDTILGGLAKRIDQPITASMYGWANESMSYPNYPYEYDPLAAKAVLDSKFLEGSTPNPYYDIDFPGSAQYIRTYPADHPTKAGLDLNPLKIKIASNHSPRLQAGRLVYGNLRKLGVPCDVQEAPTSTLYSSVMQDFNYHFYTGGWTGGRFPPLSLYGLYHSNNAFPGGGNYVTGVRPGVPTHPKLDAYLYAADYATSYSEAVTNTKLASGYMTEICVNVPLWSTASYWAWNKNLLGVVNAQGHQPENDYTFMNAYKTDGSPIRCGTINLPTSVNIVYSSWVYDYNVLDRMNQYSGATYPAYNMALDMGGFTRNWETTTWDDNSTIKTKLVMTFRSNGYFVKPASGDQGRNVNATHYFLSAWFCFQVGDAWDSYSFHDLHHVDITSSHTFEIYFDTYSYWNTYYCQGPLLPIDTWAEHPELITKHNETTVDPTAPGFVATAEDPVWFTSITFNGTPLTLGADYNIVKGQLYVYNALGPGTLIVQYLAVGDPHGYTPGDLPWEITFEGAGMYYATAFTPGTGGSVTYKRNPFYWMETPPLGEVDFARKQVGGRPIGPHKVDIYDLALAGGAFGSQGTGTPSSNWFPGADLAPNGGVNDIFDEVTVTGVNWNKEFDPPE